MQKPLVITDLINVSGDGRAFLRLEITKHLMTFISELCLFPLGMTAMIWDDNVLLEPVTISPARKAMKYIECSVTSEAKGDFYSICLCCPNGWRCELFSRQIAGAEQSHIFMLLQIVKGYSSNRLGRG